MKTLTRFAIVPAGGEGYVIQLHDDAGQLTEFSATTNQLISLIDDADELLDEDDVEAEL